jgi:hypothetical protein
MRHAYRLAYHSIPPFTAISSYFSASLFPIIQKTDSSTQLADISLNFSLSVIIWQPVFDEKRMPGLPLTRWPPFFV